MTKVKSELVSANNWLTRAGTYFDGSQVVFPHKFLLVPMTLASEAIIEFRAHENIGQKIKHGLVVVTMIRIAETAYFKYLSEIINFQANKKIKVCHNCVRGKVCGTRMGELRRKANRNIIHKMEDGKCIDFEDLSIVEEYYDECFKLQLVGSIEILPIQFSLCHSCARKYSN